MNVILFSLIWRELRSHILAADPEKIQKTLKMNLLGWSTQSLTLLFEAQFLVGRLSFE